MSRFFSAALLVLLAIAGTDAVAAASDGCDRPKLGQPEPVRAPADDEVLVATQNLRRLFDDVDDGGQVLTPAQYELRRTKLARQIVDVLHVPDVLAVQEVENHSVLSALAADVAALSGRPPYRPLVMEGNDPGGIDVGFLVRPDWKVLSARQLLAHLRLGGRPLFDRPPLHLVLQDDAGRQLELVNVHLKSLKGSEHPGKKQAIAGKRRQQALALAAWWRQQVSHRPQATLLMLGDFNATPEILGGVDVLGELRSAGLVAVSDRMPAAERYTYVFQCRPELIDNILASPGVMTRVRDVAASRGNADARSRARKVAATAAGSSDHDALVLYLSRH